MSFMSQTSLHIIFLLSFANVYQNKGFQKTSECQTVLKLFVKVNMEGKSYVTCFEMKMKSELAIMCC